MRKLDTVNGPTVTEHEETYLNDEGQEVTHTVQIEHHLFTIHDYHYRILVAAADPSAPNPLEPGFSWENVEIYVLDPASLTAISLAEFLSQQEGVVWDSAVIVGPGEHLTQILDPEDVLVQFTEFTPAYTPLSMSEFTFIDPEAEYTNKEYQPEEALPDLYAEVLHNGELVVPVPAFQNGTVNLEGISLSGSQILTIIAPYGVTGLDFGEAFSAREVHIQSQADLHISGSLLGVDLVRIQTTGDLYLEPGALLDAETVEFISASGAVYGAQGSMVTGHSLVADVYGEVSVYADMEEYSVASAAGNVWINDNDWHSGAMGGGYGFAHNEWDMTDKVVELLDVTTGNGTVTVLTGGTMLAHHVGANDINLVAGGAGSIGVGALETWGSTVTLDAAREVYDLEGGSTVVADDVTINAGLEILSPYWEWSVPQEGIYPQWGLSVLIDDSYGGETWQIGVGEVPVQRDIIIDTVINTDQYVHFVALGNIIFTGNGGINTTGRTTLSAGQPTNVRVIVQDPGYRFVPDATNKVEVTIDFGDGTWTYDPNGAFEDLSPGRFAFDYFRYAMQDASGARSEATVSVRIEPALPLLKDWRLYDDNGISKTDKLTNDPTPTLLFLFSEPVFGDAGDVRLTDPSGNTLSAYSIDGWGSSVLSLVLTSPLTRDGTYTATFNAGSPDGICDQAGNLLNNGIDVAVQFVLDTAAPVVTVQALLTDTPSPELTGTVNDPQATVKILVGGKTYTAVTHHDNGTWTLPAGIIGPALADGVHEILATATDRAGNAATDGSKNELTVDTAAPAVTVNFLEADDATPPLTGKVSDPLAQIQVVVVDRLYLAVNHGDGTWTLPDNAISPALALRTYDVEVTATDPAGNAGHDATVGELTVLSDTPLLRVTTLQPTVPALNLSFNYALNLPVLNLYDAASRYGPADLTLVGDTVGPVAGSLVYDPQTRSLTFVKTGGPLAPGTYTLTLRGAANGLTDSLGNPLDGDGDHVPGGDYVTTFTIEPSDARLLSVPDFTRGPGQDVDVPLTGNGIPVTLSQGSGVQSVTFVFEYDPALLEVRRIVRGAAVPSDWQVAYDLSEPGRIPVVFYGTRTTLPAGTVRILEIEAAVPDDAPYAATGLLRLADVQLNKGAIAATADGGVQAAAYLGDATGNYRYSALDAAYIARVGVKLDSGFAAGYRLKDPVLIGDVSGNGSISALDAAYFARKVVGFSMPQIPDLPSVLPPIAAGGRDPLLSIPDNLTAYRGQTLTVSVSILDDATDLIAVDLYLEYDTTVFDVANSDVHAGDLTAGWTVVPNVDDATGTITVAVFGTEFLSGGTGSVVEIDFHVRADAPYGPTDLDLRDNTALNEGELVVTLDDGLVTILAANALPTVALANTTTGLAENTDTSARLKVADIVVTDDGVGTNVLSLSGADAALFEIVGTVLYLKAGTIVDYEMKALLNVTVVVDDASVGSTPDATVSLSVGVTNVNEAPIVSLTNTATSLAENADTSTRLKVADIVVTDDALGTNVLSLSGADASLFEIEGTVLYLKAGTVLDYETKTLLAVTVVVDDAAVGSTPDDTADLSILVTDVNEPPTAALANTATSLAENTDTSTRLKVADIVVTDDALGTNVLSLSGADASLFEIEGTVLYLKAGTVLDHDTNPQLAVTVAVDDASIGSTPDDTADLSITVTDVNEPPTVSLTNTITSLPENTNTSTRLKVADVVVTDDALGVNALSLSGADASLFEIDSLVLYLKAGTVLDYETKTLLAVTVAVDDASIGSTPDDTADLSIAITDVNEPPTVALPNTTTSLAENTATTPRVKVADIVVTDDGLGTNVLSLSGTDTPCSRSRDWRCT